MSNKRGAEELLQQPAVGVAVRSHAALFVNNIPLLVELTHDGMEKTLGFEIGPKLDAIAGKRVNVAGFFRAGKRVKPYSAVFLHDSVEGMLDHVFLGLGHRILPGLLQAGHFCLVAAELAATLAIVSRVRRFHFGQCYLFRGPVRGADLVRSLERHMLEHVSQPGNAGIFAIAANVHMGKEGEDGGLMPLADQNRQSVAQHLHGDPLFER